MSIKFNAVVQVPTHRLADSDDFDACPSVMDLLKAGKHPVYLIEISGSGYIVSGGKIVGAQNDKPDKPKKDKPKENKKGKNKKGKNKK